MQVYIVTAQGQTYNQAKVIRTRLPVILAHPNDYSPDLSSFDLIEAALKHYFASVSFSHSDLN